MPPAIAVAAVVFAAAAATFVDIVATDVAVTIAANAALLQLRWHLCCTVLSSFCCASWLLPVCSASVASIFATRPSFG